jgi:hypothetical protein
MRTASAANMVILALALAASSACDAPRVSTAVSPGAPAADLQVAAAGAKPISSAVQFGSAADDAANAIAVARLGVAVVGSTLGALGQSSAGGSDAFVRLFNTDGTLVWSRQFGTAADDGAYGVALDRTGVYVTATSSGALASTNLGATDGYVQKLDAVGNLLWVTRLASAGADSVFGVAVDRDAIYVAGELGGQFNGSTPADPDGFVAKLDAQTGQILWITRFAGALAGDDGARDVVVDRGAVFVAATYQGGPLGTGPGLQDAYLVKLDATTGAVAWYTALATAGNDVAMDVAVDRGSVFLSGTRGTDAFVAAADAQTGALLWTTALATNGTDIATTLVADRTTVYVGGGTDGALTSAGNAGQFDVFRAQLDAATGAVGLIEQYGTSGFDSINGSAMDGRALYLAGIAGGTLVGPSLGATDAWWATATSP